jgi:hypothetical protein
MERRMTGDGNLLRRLRAMWETLDPAPPDLADRVLLMLDLEDLEYELLCLAGPVAADVRGQETIRTVTFTGDRVTVILVLPAGERAPRRIDGWLSPRAALHVELRMMARTWITTADVDGRFAFDDLPAGLCQLVVRPTAGAAVQLGVAVVTPGISI